MPHQCTSCGYTFADGSKEMLGGCPDCGGNTFQFKPEESDLESPDESADPPESNDPGGAASTVGRAATKVRDFVSRDDPPSSDQRETSDETSTRSRGVTADAESDSSDDSDAVPDTASNADTASATDTAPDTNTDSGAGPDADAPWPDSSDAADPIRRGGLNPDGSRATEEGDAEDDSTTEATDETEDVFEETGPDTESEPAKQTDEILDGEDEVPEGEDYAQASARSEFVSDAELAQASDTPDEPESPEPPDPDNGHVVSEPNDDDVDMTELREQLNEQFESIKIVEPGQYELNLMELYDRDEYIIALQENGRYAIQMPEQWMGDDTDR